MNYLAIDTSGKNLTVVASYNGKEQIFFDNECGVNHSVLIMPKIEEVLSNLNFNLADADFIACVVGAGSFTGIRIGVSTAKALCFAYNKKCLPVTSFDCIAYNKQDGKYLAVLDAGHNGYYVCGYTDGKITYNPCYIDGATLEKLSKEYTLISGETIKNVFTEVVCISEGLKKAIEYKKDEISDDIESLTPLYLRKSQAEEGR